MKRQFKSRLAAGTMALALLQGAVGLTAAEASAWTSTNVALSGVGALPTAAASGITAGAGDGRYTGEASGAIPKAIQQTSPSVVAIIGKYAVEGQEAGRFDLAHGTGVIVGSDGTIITNAHVVKDMDHIVVVTYDGKQYNGKVTHYDEESDLALVRIQATGLKEAVFAAKSDIQVGETVIAIGTPISFSLRNSVTVGVISGLDRSVNSTYRLLQTDAAINPGNSGGALVNLKGEVVGINTLKVAEYGVDNLGFAIPSDTVQYVLKHFQTYGKVKRPYVGIELEESWAAVVGIPTEESLTVGYVEPGSPADKAGIKSGDGLLSVGNVPVKSLVDFNELLKGYLPGDTVEFTLQSGGSTVKRYVLFTEEQGTSQDAVKSKEDDSDFDTDAGKTRIGDSQYGWSMKYPSGLGKYYQSAKGDSVTLGDARGEYSLHVRVEEKQRDYSKSALLKALADKEEGSTILDRKYVEGKSASYARVISKDDYGYYESRAYMNDGYVYYVTMSIYEEQDYKNTIKRKGYTELMDSFVMAFDGKDTSLKDLAANKDGFTKVNHPDYGYAFSVPSEWDTYDYTAQSRYEDPDGEKYVDVFMASMAEGDSLTKWAERTRERMLDRYVKEYIESGELKDTKVAGLSAKEWTVSESLGDEWTTTRLFFFEKDGYKYRLEIGYPKETAADEAEKLVNKVVSSFQVNGGTRNPNLGYMEDEEDLVDYSNTLTVRNKTYGYTLEVPEFWETGMGGYSYGNSDDDYLSYSFLGGSFVIVADKDESYEDAVKSMDQYNKNNQQTDSDYKYAASDVKVFGVPARKYVIHYERGDIPLEITQYVFSKDGVTYMLNLSLYDAVRTESNLQDMQKAFESLRFNGK